MDRVYAHVPTPRQDEEWTLIQRFVQEIYSRSNRSDGVRHALATIVEVTNPHWADLSAQRRSEIYALIANAHDAICDNPDLSAEDIRRILPLGAKLVLLMSQELEARVWVDKLPRSILDETVHRMAIENRRDGSSSGELRDALERAEGLHDGWDYYSSPEKLEILEKFVALTERAEASLVSLPDGAPRDTRPSSEVELRGGTTRTRESSTTSSTARDLRSREGLHRQMLAGSPGRTFHSNGSSSRTFTAQHSHASDSDPVEARLLAALAPGAFDAHGHSTHVLDTVYRTSPTEQSGHVHSHGGSSFDPQARSHPASQP